MLVIFASEPSDSVYYVSYAIYRNGDHINYTYQIIIKNYEWISKFRLFIVPPCLFSWVTGTSEVCQRMAAQIKQEFDPFAKKLGYL